MKFTIEIDEFWLDEDSDSLQNELKNHIKSEVISEIYSSIKKQVDTHIKSKALNLVEKTMASKTDEYITECLKDSTISQNVYKNGGYVEEKITLQEYIVNAFKVDSGWSNPNEVIKREANRFAESFGNEIKERYDLLFATQIVQKLDKEGLLKENVAKLILENK